MLSVLFLLFKGAAVGFALCVLYALVSEFVRGFKEGLAKHYAPHPHPANSTGTQRMSRSLRMPAPAKPMPPDFDVEAYYEEQLRIESRPQLRIFGAE